MTPESGQRVLDAAGIRRAIARIAERIVERHGRSGSPALVGIRTRGVPLAARLADALEHAGAPRPDVGTLDINLYRDDLSRIADHPILRRTEIPFDLDGAGVVLVDDVLFTGRTIRAALDGLMDLGRPAWVELAVLVDRGHREVPIQPDYVGEAVPTGRGQEVAVRVREVDGADEVVLLDARDATAADGEP